MKEGLGFSSVNGTLMMARRYSAATDLSDVDLPGDNAFVGSDLEHLGNSLGAMKSIGMKIS